MSRGNSSTASTCPAPFISNVGFGNGGYLAGRFCGANPIDNGTYCCLPCPSQQWIYSDNFLRQLDVPEWISVGSLIACSFLLISWVFLDPDKSHRHYLSVGLIVSFILVQLSFVIPLAAQPDLCYDAITPKDMHTSMSCAWSGALFQAGGIATTVWIALRSLWLHIRVCWDRSPGKTFLYFSITIGILVPLIFLVTATVISGYSFRLGSTCVVNSDHAFAVFWGWILAFSVAAFIMQWITTAYCIGVYFRSVRQDNARRARNANTGSSAQHTLATDTINETGTRTGDIQNSRLVKYSRLRWQRLRSLFFLQWRGFAISLLVVLESIFFVVVFWSQDRRLQDVANHPELQPDIAIWSICLTFNKGNKVPCLDLVKPFIISHTTVLASFVMAALIGLIVSLVLLRFSIFAEWIDVFKRLFRRRRQAPQMFDEPGRFSREDLNTVNRQPQPPHRFSMLSAALGGTQFMGSSNRRMSRESRFHPNSRAKIQHDTSGLFPGRPAWPDGEERDSWGWNRRERESFALGVLGEEGEGEASSGLRMSPRAAGAVPRTLVRDPASRASSLRLETHDEALRRWSRLGRRDRDSLVLGDNTSPSFDQDDNQRPEARSTKAKGRSSSWASGGSGDSETLEQSTGQVRAFVNPLRMNRPSVAEPLTEPNRPEAAGPKHSSGMPNGRDLDKDGSADSEGFHPVNLM